MMIVRSDPDNKVTTWTYDSDGMTTSYIDPNGKITTMQFDAGGRTTTILYASGIYRKVQFDNLNRPTSQIDYFAWNQEIQRLTYTYDTVGNPSGILDGSGVYLAYGYDAKNRVTTAVYTNGGVNSTFAYGYDAVDNKTFDSFPAATTFAYDLAGQLVTSVQGGYVTTYTYDANGNQTNQQLPWQKTTMSYDKENRLLVFKEDASVVTYTYDGVGRKRLSEQLSGKSTFVWDGFDLLQERKQSEVVKYDVVNHRVMASHTSTGRRDYLVDLLGSVTAEIDQTQVRVYEARYSAFGRKNWSTGSNTGFGWIGSLGYQETGLFTLSHYVRARHFSTTASSWSTLDSLWPQQPGYSYVGARPTFKVDPTGKVPLPCLLPCSGVAVCAIDLWLVCRDWDTEGFTSFRDCAGAVLANLPPSVRLGCILGLATCLTCLERYVPKPGIVPPGAGVIGGVIYLTKEFKYGKCCGYDLACNSCDTVSNGGAIDCVDQACASHDSCLATWREYLDPRQQYDCARKLCQSINECLESGGGAISPDPKACIQVANEIRILYCTMELM